MHQELFTWFLLDLKLITSYIQGEVSYREQNLVAGFKAIKF